MRHLADALLLLAAALTAALAIRMLWYILHGTSNAPFADEWLFLDEIRRFDAGQTGWSYLWSPYWGQRNLLPRVLLLFSVRYLSLSSLFLNLTGVAAQIAALFTLIGAVRALFPARSRPLAACSIMLAHLMLSSLQMENFITGMGVQHAVGYASAVSALALFGRRPWIGILLALLSTACLASGLALWPILVVEAWMLGLRTRTMALLLAASAVLIPLYLTGYTRPAMGMGFSGAMRHPFDALSIAALVLGGPITLYSLRLGTIAGLIGLLIVCGLLARHCRRPAESRAAAPLLLIAVFQVALAASLAVGRYTPEWLAALHGRQPLPSRYLTPAFLLWGALLPLCLHLWRQGRLWRAAAVASSVVVLAITFGTWPWQWRVSREWAIHFQRFDATASGFLLGISDSPSMNALMSDEPLRQRVVAYLKNRRLSVFSEPRGAWLGREIHATGRDCRVSATSTEPVLGDRGAYRVRGSLEINGRKPRGRIDLLIASATGTVVGLARSLPAESEDLTAGRFFGYARTGSPAALRMLPVLSDHSVCDAGEIEVTRP